MSDNADALVRRNEQLQRRVEELENELARLRTQSAGPASAQEMAFVQALPEVVFETDLQGRFLFANEYGLRCFGYSSDDLARGISIFDIILPEEHEKARQRFERAFRESLPSPELYTAVRKDGTLFPVMVHARILHENGRPQRLIGVLFDASGRMDLEEQLRRERDRMTTILHAIPDIVFVLDEEARYVDVLTSHDELLYRQREELIGKRLHQTLPDDVAEQASQVIREALVTEQPRTIEYSLDLPEGTRWFEGRTATLDNKRRHVVFTAHDITARKQAELALQQAHVELERRVEERTRDLETAQRHYRTLFENLLDVAFALDETGCFSELSPSFERVTGYAREAWLGRPISDLTHPDDLANSQELFHSALSGDTIPDYEIRARLADGRWRLFQGSLVPMRESDGRMRIAGLVRDVTEARAAQEAVRASEARYRHLFEAVPDVVYTTDADNRLTSLSPSFEQVLGHAPGPLLGQIQHMLDLLHPADRERTAERLRRLRSGESTTGIVRLRSLAGDYRTFEVVTRPIMNSGQFDGTLGVARDITERRRTEEALLHSERMAAVGTLAAGVAHEFNNIHTSVLGFLEMALLQQDLPEKTRELLQRVHRSASRAARVTRNLLAFSRPEQTERRPLCLDDVVSEIAGLVRAEYASEGVTLTLQPGKPPPAIMDPAQIGQVLLNLLINARHATLGRPERRIDVLTGNDGDRVFVRVRDTGCGIAAEHLPYLFLPFFSTKGEHSQVGSPQSTVRGTGLGLSICDTIVRNHGGTIEVTSTPDDGATFTVWLPQTTDPKRASSATILRPRNLSGRHILVLDDEPDVRDLLESFLTRQGARVSALDDGGLALDLLEQNPCDLALVDLQMPKMAGETFVQALRERSLPDAPALLLVTGRTFSPERQPCDEDILTKPFGMEKLLQRIETLLAKRDAGRSAGPSGRHP